MFNIIHKSAQKVIPSLQFAPGESVAKRWQTPRLTLTDLDKKANEESNATQGNTKVNAAILLIFMILIY